jgi:hypothetical protein
MKIARDKDINVPVFELAVQIRLSFQSISVTAAYTDEQTRGNLAGNRCDWTTYSYSVVLELAAADSFSRSLPIRLNQVKKIKKQVLELYINWILSLSHPPILLTDSAGPLEAGRETS